MEVEAGVDKLAGVCGVDAGGRAGPGEKPHQLDQRRFGVRPLGAGRKSSPQGRTHTAGNIELCKKVNFWQVPGTGEVRGPGKGEWRKSRGTSIMC